MIIDVKVCMGTGTYPATFDTVNGHIIADFSQESDPNPFKHPHDDYMIMPSGTIVPLCFHPDDDEDDEDSIFAVKSEDDHE